MAGKLAEHVPADAPMIVAAVMVAASVVELIASGVAAASRAASLQAQPRRCPACHSAVPPVVIGASVSHNAQLPDAVEELLRSRQRSRRDVASRTRHECCFSREKRESVNGAGAD